MLYNCFVRELSKCQLIILGMCNRPITDIITKTQVLNSFCYLKGDDFFRCSRAMSMPLSVFLSLRKSNFTVKLSDFSSVRCLARSDDVYNIDIAVKCLFLP